MASRTVEINGEKLRKLFAEKGLRFKDASLECGLSANYWSNACGYNVVNRAYAQLLEIKYGIMLDDYKADEPKPEPQIEAMPEPIPIELDGAVPAVIAINYDELKRVLSEVVGEAVKIDYAALGNVIGQAMLDSLIAAMSTGVITDKLQMMLYAAIKGALKKISQSNVK